MKPNVTLIISLNNTIRYLIERLVVVQVPYTTKYLAEQSIWQRGGYTHLRARYFCLCTCFKEIRLLALLMTSKWREIMNEFSLTARNVGKR